MVAIAIQTGFSARKRPAQILRTNMRECQVDCERVTAHLRPHPYTAFTGKVSPAPSGLGKKRSGLKERASWNLFSSHVSPLNV